MEFFFQYFPSFQFFQYLFFFNRTFSPKAPPNHDTPSTIQKFFIDHTIMIIIIIERFDEIMFGVCVRLSVHSWRKACGQISCGYEFVRNSWVARQPSQFERKLSIVLLSPCCLLYERRVHIARLLRIEHSAFGAKQCWWRLECRTWVLRFAYHWKLK